MLLIGGKAFSLSRLSLARHGAVHALPTSCSAAAMYIAGEKRSQAGIKIRANCREKS